MSGVFEYTFPNEYTLVSERLSRQHTLFDRYDFRKDGSVVYQNSFIALGLHDETPAEYAISKNLIYVYMLRNFTASNETIVGIDYTNVFRKEGPDLVLVSHGQDNWRFCVGKRYARKGM
jgi:hypothetical protein